MLNLFNTLAYAEQNSFWAGANANCQTATCGCDGDMIEMDTGNPPATYSYAYDKVVSSAIYGSTSVPQFWKVTFA